MVTSKELLKKIENDILYIEDRINNYEKYNKENYIKRKLIKNIISIDNTLPLLLSLIIVFYAGKTHKKTPFLIDTYDLKLYTKIIDTSEGYHEENVIAEENQTNLVEYSTGWKINEYGLFERTSTKYIIKENNLNYEIINQSKETLDNNYIPLESEIITVPTINKKDEIYNENVIVITRMIDNNLSKEIKETNIENIISTLLFLIPVPLISLIIKKVKKIITYDYIENKLGEYEIRCREIDENEIEKLKEILEIKKENLSILEGRQKRK